MTEPSPFDALLERIVSGAAAPNIRSAAARGALPLPRATLIQLYVLLLEDSEKEIRESATESLDALSVEAIREALEDQGCRPKVLAHFAKLAARQEQLAEKIVFHPSVPPGALTLLAAAGSAAVIDLVLTNQERLLSQPSLLERLMLNPALRADQRGRILELLDRVVKHQERSAEAGDAGETDVDAVALEEAARLLDVDVGELLSASEIMGGEEFEESEDPEIRDAYQKIITLNAAQKAILAMKGGREERMILVRDSNKVVALAVLKNGRITEQEVSSIARMRNVTGEVLRQIGTSRDWIKNYTTVLGLVSNPRTPQGVSANFISRLTNKDLKGLATSRDVPELIRRMAKRTYDTRTQAQNRGFKKKR